MTGVLEQRGCVATCAIPLTFSTQAHLVEALHKKHLTLTLLLLLLLLLLQVPASRLAQMFSAGSTQQPLQDEQGHYYL
jgi:hypothetical protein